nr:MULTISPECIES: C39 family peptidase [unclassified Gemella]
MDSFYIQPDNYKLSVPIFSQLYPDFIPMGCECVSINMALSYSGIDTNVNNFIKDIPTVFDPRKGFMGDMYSIKYYNGTVPTIWPEALIDRVQSYKSNSYVGSKLTLEDIERELLFGNPVLVWYSWEPVNIAILTDSEPLYSSSGLHAVLVVGYDNQNWYINDPSLGERKLDKKTFYSKYEAYGSKSLVIR